MDGISGNTQPPLKGSWKLSLQERCIATVVRHLGDFPHSLLCQIPTRQRKELLKSSPPLDICKLEATDVASGIDMNEVWRAICLLYDETDNIRITGNPRFDSRYLDYRSPGEDEGDDDSEDGTGASSGGEQPLSFRGNRQVSLVDEKVKGNWKAHFFTRTVQVLLHSFDPTRHRERPWFKHSSLCNSLNDSETSQNECDCWWGGLDPDHGVVLRRLMTIPPGSSISQMYRSLSSTHFQSVPGDLHHGTMLVPFRYAQYFFNVSTKDLLTLIMDTCHFRPKLLPVRCEFFYHTEIYQSYLNNSEEWRLSLIELLADFLSEIECLEFYWMGGLKDEDLAGSAESVSCPVSSIPKLFLECTFVNPTPKLDTFQISMYKFLRYYMPRADSCLRMVAPFFCSLDGVAGLEDTCTGQTEVSPREPYGGLKNLHIAGIFWDESSDHILSLLLGSQPHLKGLKLAFKALRMDETREAMAVVAQSPLLRYLMVDMWQIPNHVMTDFREVFDNFVAAQSNCALSLTSVDHSIDLVPPNSEAKHAKSLSLYTFNNSTYGVGRLLEWLQSTEAGLMATTVTISGPVGRQSEPFTIPYLKTSKRIEFNSKIALKFPSSFQSAIASNTNLQVLILNNCKIAVTDFCQFLQELFSKNTGLRKLSYCHNRLGKLTKEEFELFFRTVFSYPRLEQLVLDISYSNLNKAHLDTVGKIWASVAAWKLLRRIIVDKDLQDYEAIRHIVS